MRSRITKFSTAAAVALGLSVAGGLEAHADGTETLGPPSIGTASGTGVVNAGIGLEDAQPGNINLMVPADATVQQVLLYWSHEDVVSGDDTIEVNGIPVTGDLIGGPAFFFNFGGEPVSVYGYRADITLLGLVSPGANVLAIDGLDAQVSTPGTGAHGAGVMVIVEQDGAPAADIQLADGVDIAFCGFSEPRKTTVPQSFSFAPSQMDRVAEFAIFAGSVSPGPRQSEIRFDFDNGVSSSIFGAITADEGPLFDSLRVAVTIPAMASVADVSVQSANEQGTCNGTENHSISWLAAALAVPEPPPPPGGGEGCTPGYWKQRHHLDSWVGFGPNEDFGEVFGVEPPFEKTLRGALRQGGGGAKALGRHAVAALLNASGGVEYEYTVDQVIALVQEAFATGRYQSIKNMLEAENESGCPLN